MMYTDLRHFSNDAPLRYDPNLDEYVPSAFKNIYFPIDELILPSIILLNQKGYKTSFCCQGHLSDSDVDNDGQPFQYIYADRIIFHIIPAYICFSYKVKELDTTHIPNGWKKYYSYKSPDDDYLDHEDPPSDNVLYRIILRNDLNNCANAKDHMDFYVLLVEEYRKFYEYIKCFLPSLCSKKDNKFYHGEKILTNRDTYYTICKGEEL